MYARVCRSAADPAGRGPSATIWRTSSYARPPSKATDRDCAATITDKTIATNNAVHATDDTASLATDGHSFIRHG